MGYLSHDVSQKDDFKSQKSLLHVITGERMFQKVLLYDAFHLQKRRGWWTGWENAASGEMNPDTDGSTRALTFMSECSSWKLTALEKEWTKKEVNLYTTLKRKSEPISPRATLTKLALYRFGNKNTILSKTITSRNRLKIQPFQEYGTYRKWRTCFCVFSSSQELRGCLCPYMLLHITVYISRRLDSIQRFFFHG